MDTHGMKFVVDTTGVAKGFRDYKSAVDGIFASLSKFEAHVDKTMKGVAKASANPQALNAFRKAVSAFAKVDIDTSAARKLTALSAAMNGFKAPSNAQTANTKRFFNVLANSLPDLTNAYRSIRALNDLKAAMAGFRAPPASSAKNLTAFASAIRTAMPAFNSIRNISGLTRVASELGVLAAAFKNLKVPSASQVTNLGNFALAFRSFNFSNLQGSGNFYAALGAISNFRGPSPAQIRNLQNFVTAVANMRVPPNAAAVAAALRAIAEAASRAGGALGGLRSGLGGLGGSLGNLGNQARGASLNMMGLQNAFSGTFQVASVLRSLLGSLTIAELGRNFFEATNAAIQFRAQMSVLNKDLGFANAQFVYVRDTALSFGTDMLAAATGFAKISIAADKAQMSVAETRHIFEGMSTAMTVLGTTTAGQQDVWLALQQVMNKGYLSAEELNQQLNEKLPGAMAYAGEYAKSLGVSLEEGLKTKALDASGVLAHIAKRMKEDFGPAVTSALMRPQAQLNNLKTNITSLFIAIGEAGANDAFANLLFKINTYLTPEKVQAFATAIGEGLANAVNKLGQGIDWLAANWDSIKGPLATATQLLGQWMIVSSALNIGGFLITPLIGVAGALGPVLGGLRSLTILMAALTASTLPGAAAAVARLTGAWAAVGVVMLQARNAIAGTIIAMNAARASSGLLAAGLVGLQAAGAAATRGIGMLVTMLGGPLGIALLAATAGIAYLTMKYWEMEAAFASTQPTINEVNAKLMQMGDVALVGATNTKQLAAEQEAGKKKVDNFAGSVGGLAQQLYDAALAAYTLRRELLQANLTKLQTQRNELTGPEGFLGNLGRGAKEVISFGGYSQGVIADLKKIDPAIADVKGRLAALGDPNDPKSLERLVTPGMRQMFGAQGGGRPKPAGGGGGGGGGGGSRKVKDFEAEANKIENIVDGLMDKLLEGDPIGALTQDYIKSLTDQAHALLNTDGYKQFFNTLRTEADKGKLSVETLISTMGDPKNLSGKAIEDLAARYNVSVDKIISLLREQQTAFEEAKQEAVIKALDKDFRGLAKGMDMVGDSIPAVAEMKANIEALTGIARMIMPADEGFAKFLTDVRSGAISSTEALEKLSTIMNDPSLRSAQGNQFFANADTTPDEVIAAERRRQAAAANARRESELDLEFGERLLSNRRDEITLLQLSTNEAEAYRTVQEEVNRARAAGLPLDEQKIQNLLTEVRAQQQLANQLQRNKEFFENNGVRGYINDIKSVGESINELDKNVLQSLEDQLFSLGTTGKFSFQAIFDTLQQGLIRFASQNLLKEGLGKLFGGAQLEGGQPSLLGGLFKAMGFDYAAGTTDPLGSSFANPMHVTIDPTTGNFLFGTNKSITMENDVTNAKDALVSGLTQAGTTFKTSVLDAGKGFGGILSQFLSGMSGGGGGGGLLGGLLNLGMGLLGGGAGPIASLAGDAAATIAANPGIFKEGGYPGSPVARTSIHPSVFTNAPHYKEGTPNTSGGHPAILHDNEAVIPLSRGRKVPVEMAGGSRGQVINNNFVVNTPDANSFKKSQQQIATNMHMQAGRAYRRNHG